MVDKIVVTKSSFQRDGREYVFPARGAFPRVSCVLDSVNWASEALDRWKTKLIVKYAEDDTATLYDKTQMLQLLNRALATPGEELRKAGRFGTTVHDYVEKFLNTGEKSDLSKIASKTLTTAIGSVDKFFTEWNISPSTVHIVANEFPFYSASGKYAGCIDSLIQDMNSGNLFLFDWKTSNAFRQKYYLQTAAYWYGFEEMTGQKIDKVYIVVFHKDSVGYEVKEMDKALYAKYLPAWQSALTIYNFINNL